MSLKRQSVDIFCGGGGIIKLGTVGQAPFWPEKSVDDKWKPGDDTLIYYSFNNQNLNDESGNGNNGTWKNGAGTFVSGIKGYGVQNGNRGIQIPISLPSGDFTFLISIYPQNLSSPSLQTILGSVERDAYKIHLHATQTITLATNQQGNMSTGVSLDLNQWNNLALVRSGDNWKIYKNGTQILDITFSFTMSGGTYLVGCGYNDDRHINGILDEVVLENKAWTQAEIQDFISKNLS